MTFEEKLKNCLILFEFNNYDEVSKEEINKRYKILAKKYHPDTSVNKDGNEFVKLIDAKNFLINNLAYIENLRMYYYSNNSNEYIYSKAIECFNSDDYLTAINLFSSVGDYKDSIKLKEEAIIILESINNKIYNDGISYFNKKRYFKTIKVLNNIKYYKDSSFYINESKKKINIMYSFILLLIGLIVTLLLLLTIAVLR